MMTSSLSVVRLTPKADTRALRHGFPWVYSNELVTDRRTKALTPGTIALLEDSERRPMGIVAVTPASKIICRILDRDPESVIDEAWFAARIETALAHRSRLYPDPFYRLIHAEADGLPGVVIDRFGDVAVVQPNAAWADRLIEPLTQALMQVTGVATVIMNGTGRARTLEGLPEETRVLIGTAPAAPIAVPMNGATYMADVMGGQKTGLFFDQRPNHAFAASLAKAKLAAPLVAPGGYLGLCSCSHAADLSAFRNASARGIGRGGRRGQLIYTGFAGADHPQLPQLAESGYLKAVFFRL
ncbi:MAG: RlmI/RlmK family 23S rRNA methyltransferase [Rhodobacteraceae bacterium]|nr:RlmI/RlmK family 23S rRNA methyltransferase [Paracoccaceae bacterium]